MNGYALLRPLLASVAAGRPLTTAPPSIRADAPSGTDEHDATAQARDELGWAWAVLDAVAGGAHQAALRALLPLLEAPLRPSPLETALEDVGVRLASDQGDGALVQAFLERRRAYQERFASGAALLGLGVLLERPASLELFAPASDTIDDGPATQMPVVDPPPVSAGFVPFAAAPELDTPAYVVTLRHLQDARTATFAVHRVAWHDLESEDATVSDLVLDFESDARAMLRSIDPDALRLRLFFGDGRAYDEAATADGTLFDVEVNPAEGRIYLKLRRPAAWGATGLPPADLWRHLRSCVLITEPG